MNTFLPFSDFTLSARSLDYRRLGRQRVECWQILHVLSGEKPLEKPHPVYEQWRGYEVALLKYTEAICDEWVRRGYIDNLYTRCKFLMERMIEKGLSDGEYVEPHWLGQRMYHQAQRSNLLRKDPAHYGRYEWDEPNDIPYVWPKGRPREKS